MHTKHNRGLNCSKTLNSLYSRIISLQELSVGVQLMRYFKLISRVGNMVNMKSQERDFGLNEIQIYFKSNKKRRRVEFFRSIYICFLPYGISHQTEEYIYLLLNQLLLNTQKVSKNMLIAEVCVLNRKMSIHLLRSGRFRYTSTGQKSG